MDVVEPAPTSSTPQPQTSPPHLGNKQHFKWNILTVYLFLISGLVISGFTVGVLLNSETLVGLVKNHFIITILTTSLLMTLNTNVFYKIPYDGQKGSKALCWVINCVLVAVPMLNVESDVLTRGVLYTLVLFLILSLKSFIIPEKIIELFHGHSQIAIRSKMKCLLMLALVGLALSHHVDVPAEDHDAWDMFKIEHTKEYNDEHEEHLRKQIFLDNLKFVREHNAKFAKGEVTFDVAINRFADLTAKEFGALMNGYKSPEVRNGKEFDVPDDVDVPKAVDWRKKGAVTPVKDQGQCGSCWAFSATGSLEGQTYVAKKKLVSLSEQNLVDCSTKEGNEGCNGGLMDLAFSYIKKNGGIDTEKAYPYEARDGRCRYKSKDKGATDSGSVDIPSGSESKLQAAVATKGPVSVAIDASQMSFQLYRSGVYKDSSCGNTRGDLDHGVLAVGYGTAKKGGDYWIVKNSWGTDWGMKGYILMARNHKNMCGIATMSSYPTV